jgi:two-component system chemotaxis sensor kinase CheA
MDATFDITQEEIPIFLAEADEHLQVLDEGLVRMEHEEQDADLLQALFRAAHTLKGSAGMIGHKRMVKLTHTLEAAFDGLRKDTLEISVELMDACLEAVDVLRLLCDEVPQGMAANVEIDPVVERLSVFTSAKNPSQKTINLPAGQPEISAPESPTTPQKDAGPAAASLVVHATISPDSIASAARAFQIMLVLQEMGEILSMIPDQAQIEASIPVQEFTAIFLPHAPVEEIGKALSIISEIDQITVDGKTYQEPTQPEKIAEPAAKQKTDTPLGKILVDNKVITEDQLRAAVEEQSREVPTPLLGQTLVKLGFISQEVLDEIVAEQNRLKKKSTGSAEPPAADRSRPRVAEKTIRTSVDRLDKLMNLVGELITDRNRLNLIRGGLEAQFHNEERIDALSETITHVGRITDQLQAEVMGIRMLPISNVFNKFPRLVRDLSHKAGKQIELVIRGEDTELDRSVIEEISDPLIHLLRNAVDHGIETTEERLAAGKPERGIILLTARHEQGRIVITVEDNGRGIDLERVKNKAVDKNLISRADADAMQQEEAIDLIFVSGLSTARTVSDVSGRGVGMDIVRNNIERLNGSIVVDTWLGRGTQFQIILPLTLAIVPTLLVRVGEGTYAVPLVTVTETLRVSLSNIQTVKSRPVIVLRDHVLPVMRLDDVFNMRMGANGHAESGYEYIVVVRSGKAQMGLIVDSLVGEEEVVVKSLSSIVGDVTGISSAAILGDGHVALILDVQGLFKLTTINQQHTNRTSFDKTTG